MSKTHDARAVANTLILRGMAKASPRDPLQIIKLTYLCHGWMLGLYHQPMSAQPVYAWQYGPVIPEVYHEIKRYGRNPVKSLLDCPDDNFDELELDLIEQVYDVYIDFSGILLSQMTHAEGSPWRKIWDTHGRNAIIPNDLIEEHFSELAESAD